MTLVGKSEFEDSKGKLILPAIFKSCQEGLAASNGDFLEMIKVFMNETQKKKYDKLFKSE